MSKGGDLLRASAVAPVAEYTSKPDDYRRNCKDQVGSVVTKYLAEEHKHKEQHRHRNNQ
jgi:hypothetical protein